MENKNRDENRASGGRVRGRAGYIHTDLGMEELGDKRNEII